MRAVEPLLLGLGMLVLAGCDSAEQAATDFAEKVEKIAVEQARESLGETLGKLNEQVDQAQEDTRQWLDQAPQAVPEPPPRETPEQAQQGMIET